MAAGFGPYTSSACWWVIVAPGTFAMPSGTRSVVMPAMFWQKSNTKVPGDDSHMSQGVKLCAIRIGGSTACEVILTSGLGPALNTPKQPLKRQISTRSANFWLRNQDN